MKPISIITIIAYLICILTPNGITAGTFLPQNVPENISAVNTIKKLPKKYGNFFETNITGTINPDIIIIHDMHCEPTAQKNIINILNYLKTNFSTGYIFTEGAPDGKIDLSPLKDIYPLTTRKIILDKMIKKGLLSGTEYYGAMNKTSVLYGIERWDIYIKNIKIFNKLQTYKKYFLKNLDIINRDIQRQKNIFYNKDMLLYDKIFRKNRKKDFEYFINLKKLALSYGIETDTSYKNIKRFIEILNIPKKNSADIKKDSEYLSKILQNKISADSYIKIQKMKQDKSDEKTLILLYEYAKPFLNESEKQKYRYAEDLKYKFYLIQNFDIKTFLQEEKSLKKELFNKLFNDDKAKKTALLSRLLYYLTDYVSLEINYEEWEDINKERNDLINDNLQTNIINKEYIKKIFENQLLSDYYKNNTRRSAIFFEAIKKNMQKSKVNILVTGGFHNNITHMLNKAGLKYIVILPNAKIQNNKQYDRILTDIGITYDALSDGLLVSGISKYKQQHFLLTWIKELRHNGVKDTEIIKKINRWANYHKKFFIFTDHDKDQIDLSDIVLTSNKLSIKGWFVKVKNAALLYFTKLKQPFTYKYKGSYSENENIKKMESNIKYFPFIQLMLGFDLYSSFSTLFMQSNGYSLEFIALIFSTLAPISFISSAVTGFIGDKISKRTVILISLLIHTVGTICFAVSGLSPILLTASQILPVIGISGLNISLSPFLFKSLETLGDKESFKEIYGSNLALFWIIMSVSSLIGGLLAFFTNQITVISIAGLLDIACFTGAIIFTHKVKIKKESVKKEKINIKKHLNDIISPVLILLSNKKPLLLAAVNMIANNIFFVIFCFFLQPSFINSGLSPVFLAPIYFTANILQSLASNLIGKFSHIADNSRHRTIFFTAAGIIFSAFIITNNPLFLFLLYISMNFWQGTSSLVEISAVYDVLGDNMRSKWLAFKSMAGTIIASITQISISFLLSAGITSNSLIATGVSLLIGSSILLPKIFDRKNKNFVNINKTPNIISIRKLLYSA